MLCIASKILEKIIYYKKISGYVINYISDSQFGFLQNRSTLQQLLIFFNLLTNQANNKSLVESFTLILRRHLTQYPMSNFWETLGFWHHLQCLALDTCISDKSYPVCFYPRCCIRSSSSNVWCPPRKYTWATLIPYFC